MTSALLQAALAPLRTDPSGSAVLLDIDGTLAPIVDHAPDATVPEATRKLLITLARSYGLLACVSGRRASDARAMVSIGAITYLGSHGAEVLHAGSIESTLDPALAEWMPRVASFRREVDTLELHRHRVRVEDKGAIAAFHWRGAADETAARAAVDELAERARAGGFEVHWGRKVMEVRPPVRIDKGAGIANLLGDRGFAAALYAGDDVTDLDAFRTIRELAETGVVGSALCVGVRSDDGPAQIEQAADLVVEGTEGMQALLAALVGDVD